MATSRTSDAGSGRYPAIPARRWTDKQISEFLARVEEGKRLILQERGGIPLTTREIDDAISAAREGRN